jgi:hypothetical protein
VTLRPYEVYRNMSTAAPQPPAATPAPAAPPQKRELRIVSHCTLFYWWPVWAVGFLMALITFITGEYMVTVPPKTTAVIEGVNDRDGKPRDAYVLPAPDAKSGKKTFLPDDKEHPGQPRQPHLWMSPNKNLGVFFVVVLLLVIGITNIPLRGLWSVIVIVCIVSLVIIFALLEWWETILHYVSFLDIRINFAGYLVISLVLFGLWLVVMVAFDRQIYIVFTPGQMRVRQEIGDAETAYDTMGMTVQKQRSDLFRHWILGLGSGDLIVKTAGAHPTEIHLPNVLFIGRKVAEIEEMLRSKQVVSSPRQD